MDIMFTVIVTSFNDEKIVDEYFNNMKQQTVQPFEYIFVDGGSEDATVMTVARIKRKLKLPIKIISGKRLNIAEGYNCGIEYAVTDYVLMTGLGNKYKIDFFEKLIEKAIYTDADIVYGPILGQENGYFSHIYNLAYLRGKEGWKSPSPSNRGMLIKKKIFYDIGFFCNDFIYAGEDSEFIDRARAANVSIVYADKAILYWQTPNSWKEYVRKIEGYFLSGIQKRKIHKGLYSSIIMAILCIIFVVLMSFLYKTPVPYVAFVCCYLLFGKRIKTFNPFAIALRIINIIMPLYLIIKNAKYFNKKYLIRLKEVK